MEDAFSRTELLLGKEALARLARCRVAVFGLGGVGGFTAEALARCGVGYLALTDHDQVSCSNLNRQILALQSTIGRKKVEVMAERVLQINPAVGLDLYPCFFDLSTKGAFDFSQYDYIVDAIDTVSSKLLLVEMAKQAGIPIISCMGAGNKLDPTQFRVADLYETSVCPLARVMRHELRKRGVDRLKVVYSLEPPRSPWRQEPAEGSRRSTPGSVSFVPSVAGLILAGEVVKDLVGMK